jgi:DNA-directed RNA polymerase specialized sigma24 family protein
MSSLGSVSRWLDLLKSGQPQAAQPLWERYFQQMVALARGRLQGAVRRVADEEDVALSAFASFCRGAEAGRFPQLTDRDDLWKLLVVITARKAADLVVRQRRLKRGGGQVRGDSALMGSAEAGETPRGIEDIIGNEPTPDFAAQVAEEHQSLLAALGDDTLRQVALWKMEGYTNEEIAKKLAWSLAKVERKLGLIRRTWKAVGKAPDPT